MQGIYSFCGNVAALRRSLRLSPSTPMPGKSDKLDLASRALLWVAAIALVGTFSMSVANAFTSPIDHTTEQCTLIAPDDLNHSWFKCVDEEGNVAFRPAVEKPIQQ